MTLFKHIQRLPQMLRALCLLALCVLTPTVAIAETANKPSAAESAGSAESVEKVAIITGSSHGLGYELTKLAMAQNMKLVLVDIRPEISEQIASEYRKAGGEAIVLAIDLAKPELRALIAAEAMATFGRVDYLFNNAGYSYIAGPGDLDLAEAKRNFEVNYWAYVDLAQRVLPIMTEQKSGVIVNIASILGFTPANAQLATYSANKHALAGYFLSLAPTLKKQGVDVKVVFPAGMRTKIFQHAVGEDLDRSRDPAAAWEHPSIVAGEIFEQLHDGQAMQFPSVASDRARAYLRALQAKLKL